MEAHRAKAGRPVLRERGCRDVPADRCCRHFAAAEVRPCTQPRQEGQGQRRESYLIRAVSVVCSPRCTCIRFFPTPCTQSPSPGGAGIWLGFEITMKLLFSTCFMSLPI